MSEERTAARLAWEGPVQGRELLGGGGAIPASPGVYVWRRGSSLQIQDITNAEVLVDSVSAMCKIPFVKAANLRPSTVDEAGRIALRSGFLSFTGMTIAEGAGLHTHRSDVMDILTGSVQRRLFFQWVASTMQVFGPVLYVGESADLARRVAEHLLRTSPLKARLSELGIDLEDCYLQYMSTGDMSAERRRSLERIVTEVTFAPLTRRSG